MGAMLRSNAKRAAVEPLIRLFKVEHRMCHNYLAHHAGDAINACLR